MFLLTKFALATCAVYLGLAILINSAIFGIVRGKAFTILILRRGASGPLGIGLVLFSAMWLTAFLISWRIVISPLLDGIEKN